MTDQSMIHSSELTKKQYFFLLRKLGCFSNRSVLDVSKKGDWLNDLYRRGGKVQAIVESFESAEHESICIGSVAGSIQIAAHSVQRVLVRDPSVFAGPDVSPESTIALANLLSCLKSRGKLILPVSGGVDESKELWQTRLNGLPGKLTHRTYKTGILTYLNLTFLMRGIHQIPVLEFTVDKKLISRLEWHRLAREAVMQRMQKAAA